MLSFYKMRLLIQARALPTAAVIAALILFSSSATTAQRRPAKVKGAPRINVIDAAGLKKAASPGGKPLLINFWATWCDPCRDEFPELIQLNDQYKDRIRFITVSLDDLADIDGDVPKFLAEMKSPMPAFLLHTHDPSAAVTPLVPDWNGTLPMTLLFDKNGVLAYTRMGKVKLPALTAEIDRLLSGGKTETSQH